MTDYEMEDLYSLDESEEFDGPQASPSASDTPEATPADAAANGAVEDGVTASATASGMSGSERAMFLQLMENQQQLQEMFDGDGAKPEPPWEDQESLCPYAKDF